MKRGTECHFFRFPSPDQQIRTGLHRAADKHGLAGSAETLGECLIAGAECPCGPLAMYQQLDRFPPDLISLIFCDIMGHIIYQCHAEALGRFAEELCETFPYGMSNNLTVDEGRVGSAGHGSEVAFALGGVNRSAGKFAIVSDDAIFPHSRAETLQIIGAYLMAEAA